MIIELLDQYQISEGVLNVVINHYFNYGNKTMQISKNYFVKIIDDMLMNNVVTTIDAMNYFRNRNKRIQEYKEKATNTYKKETQIEEEVKPQTSQIDQNLLDELKKAFGD